jgi:hypothetical protein
MPVTHSCMHAHTNTRACTHIHTHACTGTYIHTHTHTHTHTHKHTHTNTHTGSGALYWYYLAPVNFNLGSYILTLVRAIGINDVLVKRHLKVDFMPNIATL